MNVEGPRCSKCVENTFGYNPVTGCQACDCKVDGTVDGAMNCSLESGQCDCNPNIEGQACDHCMDGSSNYPSCTVCDCDLHGTEDEICHKVR